VQEKWSRVRRFGALSVAQREGELLAAASLPINSPEIESRRDS
jgi:hypothetical protein